MPILRPPSLADKTMSRSLSHQARYPSLASDHSLIPETLKLCCQWQMALSLLFTQGVCYDQ